MPKAIAPLVTALVLTASPAARAQLVVTDPGNTAVNIEQLLQHLQLLRRVDAQIRNQLLMLENWEFTRLEQIVSEMDTLAEVLEAAVVYRRNHPRQRLDRIYPIEATRIGGDGSTDLSSLRSAWMIQQRDAIVQARVTQNRAYAAMPRTTRRIEEYLEQSASAPGPTAAVQAGNEVLGTMVGQFQTLQALEITAAREALEREAARQAEEARTRYHRESVMRDWPTTAALGRTR